MVHRRIAPLRLPQLTDLTKAGNRKALWTFIEDLVRQLHRHAADHTHIEVCLQAMSLALQRGETTFHIPRLWLRASEMAAILQHMQSDLCRTLLWEVDPEDSSSVRLLDISTLLRGGTFTALFTPEQLRDAARHMSTTICIVQQCAQYRVFTPGVGIADLDNTLTEYRRGLTSTWVEGTPQWRDSDLSVHTDQGWETVDQVKDPVYAPRPTPSRCLPRQTEPKRCRDKWESETPVPDLSIVTTGGSMPPVPPPLDEDTALQQNRKRQRKKGGRAPTPASIPSSAHPNARAWPDIIPGGDRPSVTGPSLHQPSNLSWSDIVSGAGEDRALQGHCIMDLINHGDRTMENLSLIPRPPPRRLTAGTRKSSRVTKSPALLLPGSSPQKIIPPDLPHYHMDSDPAATDKVYLARSHREGENCLLAYADVNSNTRTSLGNMLDAGSPPLQWEASTFGLTLVVGLRWTRLTP